MSWLQQAKKAMDLLHEAQLAERRKELERLATEEEKAATALVRSLPGLGNRISSLCRPWWFRHCLVSSLG